MLHIILTILKILGCILLGILALLLALILIVLFVPLRYEASGSFYGTPEGMAKISWLFGIIKAGGEFREKRLRIRVSLLCFTLFDSQKGEEKVTKKKVTSSEDKLNTDVDFDDFQDEFDKTDGQRDAVRSEDSKKQLSQPMEQKPDQQEASVKPSDNQASPKTVNKDPKTAKVKKSKAEKKLKAKNKPKKEKKPKAVRKPIMERLFDGIEALLAKLETAFENIEAKTEEFTEKLDKIMSFIQAECTQNSILLAKRMLWSILGHIAPKKLSGRVHFGLGKPSTTGKVLGYASLCYPLYSSSVELIPDFEKSVIEGDLGIKGSISLYIFAYWGLRCIISKDIRSLIKYIKHIKK